MARTHLGEGWQVDLSWYGLWVMEKLHLVRDVKREVPRDVRGF